MIFFFKPVFLFCTAVMLMLTSCLKKSDPEPQPVLKIGLISGLGGFNDRGFNQNILDGFQRAEKDFTLVCQARECQTAADFSPAMEYFLSGGFDLIITAGFDASQVTLDAAKANPGTDFAILDFGMPSPPANLLCMVFDVDQSSFPCGFLAAYWADKHDRANPVTGFVAGPEIPEIRQFSVSYAHGIGYFNDLYEKNVQLIGYYASSFTDTLQGAKLADSLIKKNASVIFAFAGKTGNGALYKVKEANKWAIGVDVDQYISIPQVGSVLLTSCMKELSDMVYSVMEGYYNWYFPGGSVIHATLSNKGVGMAPFHEFDQLIADSIKTELVNIENGIKAGTIKTGWPE